MYEAFGIFKCDTAEIYMDTVEQMTVKSPTGVMGCVGAPTVFCPALDNDDATSLKDGMGASDGSLDWLYIRDFYSCNVWFNYIDEQYPTSYATVTFAQNTWCASSSSGTDNGPTPGAGGTTHVGEDSKKKARMSGTALAILWTSVAVFIVICIVAISYFVYKWRQKKVLSKEQNVGLTEEKEENKFSNDNGLIGDDGDTTKDVVV